MPQPHSRLSIPARVYITVSWSGETARPCCSTSSAVLTTTTSRLPRCACRPWASLAPPTPPARSTIGWVMRRRLRDQSGASAHPQGQRGEHKNPSPGVFSDHSLAGRAIVVSQNAGACGTRDRSAWRRHEPLAPLRFPVRPVEGCQPRGAREQEDRRSAQRSLRSTRFAAPAACVGADQPLAQLGGQSQLETSIHLRRLLATIATLALLGSLVAIAPASVAASGIQSRTITKAGTGSISTGTFTPSAQTGDPLELQDEMAGDEGADNQEAGPDPYDGAISLSSG